MKQARDALRTDNNRLKQKGGLVSHPALLGDFEERKDQVYIGRARPQWVVLVLGGLYIVYMSKKIF